MQKTNQVRKIKTPLSKSQILEASKYRLYLLVKDAVVQHADDGGAILPAGRMIHLLDPQAPELEDEYLALELYIDTPQYCDPRSGLPEGVTHAQNGGRGFRLLPVPLGQEQEWLRVASEKYHAKDSSVSK